MFQPKSLFFKVEVAEKIFTAEENAEFWGSQSKATNNEISIVRRRRWGLLRERWILGFKVKFSFSKCSVCINYKEM